MKTKEEIAEQKRKYLKQWKLENKVKVSEYQKIYRDSHKQKASEYAKIWQEENRGHSSEPYNKLKPNESHKKWRKNNSEAVKKFRGKSYHRHSESLSDSYVKDLIRHLYGLKKETINENPQLIENHREQIKVKRLLKTINNAIQKGEIRK
jgi:hypothetical protein